MIGWLKRFGTQQRSVQQGNGVKWLSNLMELFGGVKTSSGVQVNETSALTIAAVYTAIRIISGTIGSLPLHVYRRTDNGGRELAVRHWAYPLLHDSPNAYHTAFTWSELVVAHLLLWGNSYNRIEWLGNGAAGELLPLMPWDVQPKLTSRGVKYYEVQLPDGREDLPDDEVLHIPGLSYDGLSGMSVIGKMRDSLGMAKAAENYGGSFFANGAKLGHVLEVPSRMDEKAQLNLSESLAAKFASPEGAFKTLVLEDGAKLHGPLTMPLKDAQFLEIRKHQRSEIFGWYGVPPHLGGDTERSTSWGTGIEQQDIGYAKHTITPLCVRIEQELNRKLFNRGSGLYCKHSLDALMRGDFQSRMQGLQIAVGGPWLTRNEAREIEDWNRSTEDAMDKVLQPLNISAGEPTAKPKEPAAAPSAPADPNQENNGMRDVHIHLPDSMTHRLESTHKLEGVEDLVASVAQASAEAARAVTASSEKVAEAVRAGQQQATVASERSAESIRAVADSTRALAEKSTRPIIQNNVRVDAPPVDVTVHLPDRRSTSNIERDDKGQITKVTQIETDA